MRFVSYEQATRHMIRHHMYACDCTDDVLFQVANIYREIRGCSKRSDFKSLALEGRTKDRLIINRRPDLWAFVIITFVRAV